MHLICCFLCEGLGEEKLSLVNKYVNNIYHYYFEDGIWIARSFQHCLNICIQEDVVSSLYDWKTDTFDIHTTECIHRYIHTIRSYGYFDVIWPTAYRSYTEIASWMKNLHFLSSLTRLSVIKRHKRQPIKQRRYLLASIPTEESL